MEAIIKIHNKKIFQKILDYLKLLGVLVYEKKEDSVMQSNTHFDSLIKKLNRGFKLGEFKRSHVYDRD
jgi:hypothetical protein